MAPIRFLLLFFALLSIPPKAEAGVLARKNYFVPKDQWPKWLPSRAANLYLHYAGNYGSLPARDRATDTLFNLASFLDSMLLRPGSASVSLTLVFQTGSTLDSAWRLDRKLRLLARCYRIGSANRELLRIRDYDSTGKALRTVSYNYLGSLSLNESSIQREIDAKRAGHIDPLMLRRHPIPYSNFDPALTIQDVWMISVGIDYYGEASYQSCASDARAYVDFFKKTHFRTSQDSSSISFHSFLLTDSMASKANIVRALETIAREADEADIFIFNFAGESNYLGLDSLPKRNYFFPWEIAGRPDNPQNRRTGSRQGLASLMLSLEELLQRMLLIPAQRQLVITEAGPSSEFKAEMLRRVVAGARETAGILNKSRVLILPNETGYDYTSCADKKISMGPIAYAVTRLELPSIDDFFNEERQTSIELQLKQTLYTCQASFANYMDVFFEKRFFKQYRSLFNEGETEAARGIQPKAETLRRESGLIGKQYALLVGTNHYKGAGWDSLSNPIYDAAEIGEVLREDYGFEVTLLKDPTAEKVYQSLLALYKVLQPNDQLLVYFAGHGDMDTYFSNDGFIVCADSKAVSEDAARTTYIPYARLKRMINRMASRQTLIMLDVCHAGTFDDNVLATKRDNNEYGITNAKVLDLVRENAQRSTRKVLTSVGLGLALDGRAGQHSPFANLILQTLRARGRNSQGIVRLDDLLHVLRAANLEQTDRSTVRKMEPYAAGFGSDEPLSEYILIPVERADK